MAMLAALLPGATRVRSTQAVPTVPYNYKDELKCQHVAIYIFMLAHFVN